MHMPVNKPNVNCTYDSSHGTDKIYPKGPPHIYIYTKLDQSVRIGVTPFQTIYIYITMITICVCIYIYTELGYVDIYIMLIHRTGICGN